MKNKALPAALNAAIDQNTPIQPNASSKVLDTKPERGPPTNC